MKKRFYKCYFIIIIICIFLLFTYEHYYTNKYNNEIRQLELELNDALKDKYTNFYNQTKVTENHYKLSLEYESLNNNYINLKDIVYELIKEMEEKMKILNIDKL